MQEISNFDYENSPYVIDETQFKAKPYSEIFYQGLVPHISWINNKNNDEIRTEISYEEVHDITHYSRSYTTNNKENIDESFDYRTL